MNNPKILIAIPYHKEKSYCLKQCFDKVEALTYKNKDVVVRFDLEKYGGKDNVKKQREYFRNLAIVGGYDYLYFMGVDTIPPDDVIERLLKCYLNNPDKKMVLGGVYWGRHGAENGNTGCAVAWIHELSQNEQSKIFLQRNQLVKVDGMGMDCVLIPRDCLEKISWLSWDQNDDDYPFYDKAKELGYEILIDTNIQCKHYFDKSGYSYLAERQEK